MSQLINGTFAPIEQMTNLVNAGKRQTQGIREGAGRIGSFQEILESVRGNELVFSKHANERLQSRSIDLSEAQLNRLNNAAKKAGEKGINESLVMVDNLAFIVSIKNNTVITAVNDKDDKVFTNIDGAVIA